MPENALDPPPPPPEETVSFTVTINKAVVLKCLENQKAWQELWRMQVPNAAMHSAMNLKYYICNGFKDITSQEEAVAAEKKIEELERPIPQIILAGPKAIKNPRHN